MLSENKYRTFWKRLLAGIIDGLIFIPLFIIESELFDTTDKRVFIGFEIVYTVCWMSYVVFGHGKYGQTLGKKLMGIRVFDLNEKSLIGYKRAFLRESIGFFLSVTGILYLIIRFQDVSSIGETTSESYDNTVAIASIIWFVTELVTMCLNNKRRAIHDFIAGSVVVDLKEAERGILNEETSLAKDLSSSSSPSSMQ